MLGCVLISDGSPQINIMTRVKPEDFYSSAHKTIFDAMQEVYRRNQPVDLITLTAKLEELDQLAGVGGLNYLSTLSNVVPSAANYKHYVDIVHKNSALRKLIRASELIIENSYESPSKQDAITFAEKIIYDISKQEDSSDLAHISVALDAVIEKFETIYKDPDSLKGLLTGFYGLDKITNGLQKGDLVLIAARPAVGKTSFAMNIVSNTAMNTGAKVAVFALEMPKEQLAQRSLCSVAMVSMEKALKGELDRPKEVNEWGRLAEANKKLSEAKIYIDDSSLNTPINILSKCRRLKREKGLDLVMIDYLQLMSSGSKNKENRQQEVSEMSRMLKVAARELNVPILLLSQLSRAVETRKGGRPILSDLRESGAIEQDADIVMFLHNPDLYSPEDAPKPGIVDLIISKHRNGALDTIKLKFDGANTTFRDVSRDSNARSIENSAPPKVENNKPKATDAPLEPVGDDDDISDIFS